MNAVWKYKQPQMSKQSAPYIEFIVKNPLRDESILLDALVDTGYDGFTILSENNFLKLRLDELEIPREIRARAETYGGEILEIRTASAEIVIPRLNITIIEDIDAMDGVYETLVGRKFLESLITTMNGPNETIELRIAETES